MDKKIDLIAMILSSGLYTCSCIQDFIKNGFERQDIILLIVDNLVLFLTYIMFRVASQKYVDKIDKIKIYFFQAAFYYACVELISWAIQILRDKV